jgi:hypothetical protein
MPKAQPLLLDLYPNAAAAYSLRKLRNGYTGSAIQVRRESDDATQNIAFDLLGELDTSTLLNFVGWNLFAWSEELFESFWGKSNLTVATDILVAPDGNMTGDVLFETTTNAAHTFQRNQTLVSGKTYTVSFWIKAQGRNNVRLVTSSGFSQSPSNAIAWLNLSSGTIVSQNSGFTGSNLTITADGSWYKVSYTMPSTQTGIVLVLALNPSPDGINTSYPGDPSLGIAVWGLQFTESSTIKPYRQTLAGAEGNGFVITWYDQSGNARNATQAAVLSQPIIVSAGVLVKTSGNIVAIDCNGKQMSNTQPNTTTQATFTAQEVSSTGSNTSFILPFYTITINNAFSVAENGSSASPNSFVGTPSYFVNNNSITSTRDSIFDNTAVNNETLLSVIGGGAAVFNRFLQYISAGFNGNYKTFEVIIYNTDQASNRTGINTAINSFYNIY